jgi:glucose-6-phosphate isomerase
LTVPELNAYGMGQLLFLLEMVTVYAGMLYQVNPFDQPGVEKLKRVLYRLMGRPGYRAKGDDVSSRRDEPGQYVI